jgi:hypothetical protein
MSGVPQRPVWGGTPIKGGNMWTVRKAEGNTAHVAVCELWTHIFGWELRLLVDGDLQRSQVCRSFHEWLDTADEWKVAFVDSG